MNTLPEDEQLVLIDREVARHLEDAEVSKLAHFDAAGTLDRRHRFYVGIPATACAILLTWLLTKPLADFQFDPKVNVFLEKGLPIMLGLITSLLTGLGNFLSLNVHAAEHREAAHKYQVIWRKCKNWKTEYPDAGSLEAARAAVVKVRDRLNEIGQESPQIPKWAWKSISSQKREGTVSYLVDNPTAQIREPKDQP